MPGRAYPAGRLCHPCSRALPFAMASPIHAAVSTGTWRSKLGSGGQLTPEDRLADAETRGTTDPAGIVFLTE